MLSNLKACACLLHLMTVIVMVASRWVAPAAGHVQAAPVGRVRHQHRACPHHTATAWALQWVRCGACSRVPVFRTVATYLAFLQRNVPSHDRCGCCQRHSRLLQSTLSEPHAKGFLPFTQFTLLCDRSAQVHRAALSLPSPPGLGLHVHGPKVRPPSTVPASVTNAPDGEADSICCLPATPL